VFHHRHFPFSSAQSALLLDYWQEMTSSSHQLLLLPAPAKTPERLLTPIPVQDATWMILRDGGTFAFRVSTTNEAELKDGAQIYKTRQKIPPLRVSLPSTDSAAYINLKNTALTDVFNHIVLNEFVKGGLNAVDLQMIGMLEDYKSYPTDAATYKKLVMPDEEKLQLHKSIFTCAGGKNNLLDIIRWYDAVLQYDVLGSKKGAAAVADDFKAVIFNISLDAYGNTKNSLSLSVCFS
jgi:hypothetical protein